MAEPVRLSAGTLTLPAPARRRWSWAGAPALMQRINSHLGRLVVRKLAFIQRLPRPVAACPARPAPARCRRASSKAWRPCRASAPGAGAAGQGRLRAPAVRSVQVTEFSRDSARRRTKSPCMKFPAALALSLASSPWPKPPNCGSRARCRPRRSPPAPGSGRAAGLVLRESRRPDVRAPTPSRLAAMARAGIERRIATRLMLRLDPGARPASRCAMPCRARPPTCTHGLFTAPRNAPCDLGDYSLFAGPAQGRIDYRIALPPTLAGGRGRQRAA